MTHRSWYIKQQNIDRTDLLQISVNTAFAIDQIINKKNHNNLNQYLENGLTLLKFLDDNLHDNTDPLLNQVNLRLRETLNVDKQKLKKLISSMQLEIKNHIYNEKQINTFLQIYDAIKNITKDVMIV
jgi:hypothetical protein